MFTQSFRYYYIGIIVELALFVTVGVLSASIDRSTQPGNQPVGNLCSERDCDPRMPVPDQLEAKTGMTPIANRAAGTLGVAWKFETDGIIGKSAVVANGLVYFGSMDKNLYAVSNETGQVKWRFETAGGIWTAPVVAAGPSILAAMMVIFTPFTAEAERKGGALPQTLWCAPRQLLPLAKFILVAIVENSTL